MKNPFWMLRSWLGWLNFFILQWFFVRLQETGELGANKEWKHLRWQLLTFPLPLSGWWTRYAYVYRGAVARAHTVASQHSKRAPRYTLLKQHLMKQLETGPKGPFFLDRMMREDGFRTSGVIKIALQDLVDDGQVMIKTRENGKSWLYEKVGRTLEE